MNNKERKILKNIVEQSEKLLSPAIVINSIAKKDEKSVHVLVRDGYLEKVKTSRLGEFYDFYTPTKKGELVFDKWYKRFWFNIRSDFKIIFISFITTIMTTVVIYFVTKWISNF
jgi:hypothetical protein